MIIPENKFWFSAECIWNVPSRYEFSLWPIRSWIERFNATGISLLALFVSATDCTRVPPWIGLTAGEPGLEKHFEKGEQSTAQTVENQGDTGCLGVIVSVDPDSLIFLFIYFFF